MSAVDSAQKATPARGWLPWFLLVLWLGWIAFLAWTSHPYWGASRVNPTGAPSAQEATKR